MHGVVLERERLFLPDGDFLDLDWARNVNGRVMSDESPLAIVLHGLEGTAKSGYAKELYRSLAKQRIASVGMNFRSCSGEINLLPRLYHSGETEDLSFVLRSIQSRFPGRTLGAVGVSLGGNVLLKHLGELGEDGTDMLRAAVAVSVPYDLSAGADFVEESFARLYRWSLVRRLKVKVRAKANLLQGRIDLARTLESRTFREFDGASTAPLHGFSSAEDYYQKSSSAGFLHAVRVPTLLIHSVDDPFLPPQSLPLDALSANDRLEHEFVDEGGHVGFVEGPPWAPRFWAERTAAAFLADKLMTD